MPVGGRKQYPDPIEHEMAVVQSPISGRDWELPGMWNRMFEQRVIWDYDTEGFEKIAALPGGESLEWCYGCGKCVPVCPVDVLVWVEDYWSYHPRGQEAARAFARVATALGIDWAIVGPEEKTVGDSQRLAGEKGLFEALMEDVVAVLSKYQFNRIVTPDPHAYNAFTKIYPKYGHEYEVLHYTQLLAPLIDRAEFN